MTPKQFEECKRLDTYEPFMTQSLAAMGLSADDFKAFMPCLFEAIPARDERDPMEMYEALMVDLESRWTASPKLPFHGPWHHALTGAILLTALRNNGHEEAFGDRDEDGPDTSVDHRICESIKRGLMIPGGTCGFHGVCGAGAGAGLAVAMVCNSTPFSDDERRHGLETNAEAMKRIAKVGGPRCCALSTYISLSLGAKALTRLGYPIPSPHLAGRCKRHSKNPQCHGIRCPCYPK